MYSVATDIFYRDLPALFRIRLGLILITTVTIDTGSRITSDDNNLQSIYVSMYIENGFYHYF
ncbi:hypothetical protein IRB23M11_23730 [Alkalibacterium sp. m-11]